MAYSLVKTKDKRTKKWMQRIERDGFQMWEADLFLGFVVEVLGNVVQTLLAEENFRGAF